ncbi:hypothetical protein V4C53_04375 [Paraburkholderia azotifigens]|uniref:hypothetical protein n=1 Tax=Paraburkholderia azotifigens TaxID=2057004 RepID=UPI00317040ED
MNESTRAVYLTFYLGETGYMPVSPDLYRMAKAGLETAITRAYEKARGNSSRRPWRRWTWFFRFTTRNLRACVRDICSRLSGGWPVSS